MRNSIFVVVCVIAQLSDGWAFAEDPPTVPDRAKEHARVKQQLFDNDRHFEKLSGSKQSVLELQFGRKERRPLAPRVQPRVQNQLQKIDVARPNPLVNNPAMDLSAHDTQSETTLVSFGNSVVASFNDSGSFDGVFDAGDHFTGFSTSNDGGRTFIDHGTLPSHPDGDAGDPVLARDERSQVIYLTTLGFNNGNVIQVFRSNDGGVTFQAPVNGVPGRQSLDKQWIAVDNFSGSGQGNVYLIARDFGSGDGIYLTKSVDGGTTWTPNAGVQIANAGAFNVQGAFVAVGPDHAVYAFWLDQSAGLGTPNVVKMRKSTDEGQSFAPAIVVATLAGTGTNGDLGLDPGFRTNSFPHAAVNPVSGEVYVVFNDDVPGVDKANVFLVNSADGGSTWSSPMRVNDDQTTTDQWQPTVAVSGDGTRLCVVWYDRRNDASNDLISTYAAVAKLATGTVNFNGNSALSDQVFPAVFGVDTFINGTYMGDYNQVVAAGDCFLTTWGDNRDLSLAEPTRRQANVRLGRICTITAPCLIVRGCTVDLQLPGSSGTAAFSQPDGSIQLTSVAFEKEDANYWYYQGSGSAHERWAVGKPYACDSRTSVWKFDSAAGKWHFIEWGRRLPCVKCPEN